MTSGRRPEITPDALTAALDGARSVEDACRALACSKQALYKRADLAPIVAAWRAAQTPEHARAVYRRVLEVPPETVQRLDILAKAHDTTRADIARRLVAAARRLPRPDPPSGRKVSLDLGEAGARLATRVPDVSRLNGVIRAILRTRSP